MAGGVKGSASDMNDTTNTGTSTQGESKAIYQFDDDSLLRFAKAIAEAVASTYIKKEDLKDAILEIKAADPTIFGVVTSSGGDGDTPITGSENDYGDSAANYGPGTDPRVK